MFQGLIQLPWWGYLLTALALTHITITAVTLYLHRHQAHRALSLHPVVSHFFRFWLWLTTGMVTREWVAVHRKHHAKVETPEDPHSPQQAGINRVLWLGALLYRREAHNSRTLERYGFLTPDDWVERHVYTPHPMVGILLMLGINLALFGVGAGLLIWITQMLWIPFWAAGVINGIGHYWGYRNYGVRDASTNIVPLGLIIGGEELHNNHHAFASSARFSRKWWEFDVGWLYIRGLAALGLARVKKLAPTLIVDAEKRRCDMETLRAVVTSRFQVMANFSQEVMRRVYREELDRAQHRDPEQWTLIRRARHLLLRETRELNETSRRWLERVLAHNPRLNAVHNMKQRLQEIWERSATTQDHLLNALQEWCQQAEASGIQSLNEFAQRLRGYRLAPTMV